MTARIRPGTRGEVGLVNWVIAQASGRVTGTEAPALFLTLGRHRRLFRGWLRFAGRLMPGGLLKRRETELVILRVAGTRGCAYELEHHTRLARRLGIDEARTARERVLLEATDELLAERDIGEETWGALAEQLGEREIIELIMLVGHYDMLATAIAALRIAPDSARR